MLIIGLGHRARQGKSTAALAFVEACPIATDVRLVAFGDALRREVDKMARQTGGFHNLLELLREVYAAPSWVRAEFEGKQRTILQWWGTDYRRKQDPDYWVKRLVESLAGLNPDVAIVQDMRFPNEADAIKGMGGVVIKVTRLGAPDVSVHEHASEAALDNYRGWDYHLQARTVLELKEQVRKVYAEIVRTRCPSTT